MRRTLERSRGTRVVLHGRELVAFAGCGYLGLSAHPRVLAALAEGAERYGVSSGASRETTGAARVHDELEQLLARFLGSEAALLMPEGALANQAALLALARGHRHALLDAGAHPTLAGAAAAAGLRCQSYPAGDARTACALARGLASEGVVVATDGVFPLEGRVAPLAELARALPMGAKLLVDDCHGMGVLGAGGRGSHEHCGVPSARLVLTGTLSKALGCYGGYIAADRATVAAARATDLHVGTTPLPPALAAAAVVALDLAQDPALRARLQANLARMRAHFERMGLAVAAEPLPVLVLTTGAARSDVRLEQGLLEAGFLVPRVEYPGAPAGGCLRLAVSAAHGEDEIDALAAAIERELARSGR